MKLKETFDRLKEKDEGALLAYITLGDPTPEESFLLAQSLIDSGSVDVMELGVPFSDPIADGPVIQAAVDRSLKAGMNTDLAFQLTKRLDKKVPVVYLTYYNIILQRGIEKFVEDCRDAGVSGLIVADLPFEESGPLRSACRAGGVDYVHIVTPNTPPGRMRTLLEDASGFVYLVSGMGVTGARRDLAAGLRESLARAIANSNGTPVAVGFGISAPDHVRDVIRMGAAGAIVGSAIVGLAAQGQGVEKVLQFTEKLKEGTRRRAPLLIKEKGRTSGADRPT